MKEVTELEAEFSEISDELSYWNGLLSYGPWAKLKAIAEGQIRAREPTLRTPVRDDAGIYEQEFIKGELAGLELFIRLPEIEVEKLKAERDRLEQEIKDATSNEHGSMDGANGGSDGRDDRDILARDAFGGDGPNDLG